MGGAFVYVAGGALCVGMALGLLPFGVWLSGAALMGAILLLGVARFANDKSILLLLVLALLCLSLGALRSQLTLAREARETLASHIGEKTVVTGRVVADPDKRATSLHLIIEVSRISGAPARGKLLALAPRASAAAYGDTIELRGTIAAPEPFLTDTGHEFDYPGYLRVQGITVEVPHAELLRDTPGGLSLPGALFSLKHAFEHSLERLLPEPDVSLLEGILVGERGGIPQELNQAFIASGLVHIVALSGYNVSLVAEAVFRTLSSLPRPITFGLGGSVMLLFTILVGAGSTTVRALLMALIALFARYFHRSALALRMLALAAVAMALWNPLILLYDTSFILSVSATFGLVTFAPCIELQLAKLRLFRRKRLLSTRSILASTLGVELFVLPVLLYTSSVFSLFALPANALVLPVVPWAMLGGFIAGLLGLAAPALGFIPALVTDVALCWILVIARGIAALPFAALVAPAFSPWLLLIIYLPLAWFAVSRYQITAASSSRAPRSAAR